MPLYLVSTVLGRFASNGKVAVGPVYMTSPGAVASSTTSSLPTPSQLSLPPSALPTASTSSLPTSATSLPEQSAVLPPAQLQVDLQVLAAAVNLLNKVISYCSAAAAVSPNSDDAGSAANDFDLATTYAQHISNDFRQISRYAAIASPISSHTPTAGALSSSSMGSSSVGAAVSSTAASSSNLSSSSSLSPQSSSTTSTS